MVVILHPYAYPSKEKLLLRTTNRALIAIQCQRKTWQALGRIRKKYRVLDKKCEAVFDYDDLILEHWKGLEDFVVIEQDIVPTVEQVDSLEKCETNFPICAYAYRYYWHNQYQIKNPRVAWLGFTKYSRAAQRMVPSGSWWRTDPLGWFNLDTRICRVFQEKFPSQEPFVHYHDGTAEHTSDRVRELEFYLKYNRDMAKKYARNLADHIRWLPDYQDMRRHLDCASQLQSELQRLLK
jgi:hypothetical protein